MFQLDPSTTNPLSDQRSLRPKLRESMKPLMLILHAPLGWPSCALQDQTDARVPAGTSGRGKKTAPWKVAAVLLARSCKGGYAR